MLVVISDLHLEECSLGVHRSLRVNRNLDPQTYEHFIRDLAEEPGLTMLNRAIWFWQGMFLK
jgi:hypothetical protein